MEREHAEELTQGAGQVLTGQFRQIDAMIKAGVPTALGMDETQWVNEKLGGYVKLGLEDRRAAHKELKDQGLSGREIAKRTGVDQATVSRDLARDASASKPKAKPQVSEIPRENPDADASKPKARRTSRKPVEPKPELPGDDEIVDGVIVDDDNDDEAALDEIERIARSASLHSSREKPNAGAIHSEAVKAKHALQSLLNADPIQIPSVQDLWNTVAQLELRGWRQNA